MLLSIYCSFVCVIIIFRKLFKKTLEFWNLNFRCLIILFLKFKSGIALSSFTNNFNSLLKICTTLKAVHIFRT